MHQKPISLGGLQGVHLIEKVDSQGYGGGNYILNKDSRGIDFTYVVTPTHDYGQEAEQMMKSLIFQRN